MEHLSEEFWSNRYLECQTGWDLGAVSPPLKAYFDQLKNNELCILIPGCGHGHEAAYLHDQGFKNVHVLDISKLPLERFKKEHPGFSQEHIHQGDFLEHAAHYDLIIEQTLFCAIDPTLRRRYAEKMKDLLVPKGKLVGLLFDTEFESGPPYGGCREEYLTYFEPYFSVQTMETCHNSISPRAGNELFMILQRL